MYLFSFELRDAKYYKSGVGVLKLDNQDFVIRQYQQFLVSAETNDRARIVLIQTMCHLCRKPSTKHLCEVRQYVWTSTKLGISFSIIEKVLGAQILNEKTTKVG
jgi:hypothetical protein